MFTKKSIFSVLSLISMMFIGCDHENEMSRNLTYDVTISEFSNSDCKGSKSINEIDYMSGGQLTFNVVDSNKLKLVHTDAYFNCEPGKLFVECRVQNDTIFIEEQEESNEANCLCSYDLEYTISPIVFGKYVVKVTSCEPFKIQITNGMSKTVNLNLE